MTHFGGDLSDLTDAPYCRQRWHSFQAYCNRCRLAGWSSMVLRRACSLPLPHATAGELSRAVPCLPPCCSKLAMLLAAKHLDRLLARDAGASGGGGAAGRDAAVAVHPGLVSVPPVCGPPLPLRGAPP